MTAEGVGGRASRRGPAGGIAGILDASPPRRESERREGEGPENERFSDTVTSIQCGEVTGSSACKWLPGCRDQSEKGIRLAAAGDRSLKWGGRPCNMFVRRNDGEWKDSQRRKRIRTGCCWFQVPTAAGRSRSSRSRGGVQPHPYPRVAWHTHALLTHTRSSSPPHPRTHPPSLITRHALASRPDRPVNRPADHAYPLIGPDPLAQRWAAVTPCLLGQALTHTPPLPQPSRTSARSTNDAEARGKRRLRKIKRDKPG